MHQGVPIQQKMLCMQNRDGSIRECVVLHKCAVTKEDIPIQIGKAENACVL